MSSCVLEKMFREYLDRKETFLFASVHVRNNLIRTEEIVLYVLTQMLFVSKTGKSMNMLHCWEFENWKREANLQRNTLEVFDLSNIVLSSFHLRIVSFQQKLLFGRIPEAEGLEASAIPSVVVKLNIEVKECWERVDRILNSNAMAVRGLSLGHSSTRRY